MKKISNEILSFQQCKALFGRTEVKNEKNEPRNKGSESLDWWLRVHLVDTGKINFN